MIASSVQEHSHVGSESESGEPCKFLLFNWNGALQLCRRPKVGHPNVST